MTSDFESYSQDSNLDRAKKKLVNPVKEEEFDSILDVPITISAVLGRTRLSIAEIVRLSEGSILDLEKAIGEPVEIFINDKQIAFGELMLIDDELSISISEIIDIIS